MKEEHEKTTERSLWSFIIIDSHKSCWSVLCLRIENGKTDFFPFFLVFYEAEQKFMKNWAWQNCD